MSEHETCGVIMPISSIDGCDERHWLEVRDIVFEAIRDAEMNPQLVSDDVEVGIIHKRIVQNIYDNPVVVCDISAKNPNVMLELGMRLAFDKPVIVIKDDKTNYSFDSSPIEHVNYPRDLRYQSVLAFQSTLTEKIKAMKKGSNGNSFLKSFGAFKISKLEHIEGSPLDVVLDELRVIRSSLHRYPSLLRPSRREFEQLRVQFLPRKEKTVLSLSLSGPDQTRSVFVGAIKAMQGVIQVSRELLSDEKEFLRINIDPERNSDLQIEITDFAASDGARVFKG